MVALGVVAAVETKTRMTRDIAMAVAVAISGRVLVCIFFWFAAQCVTHVHLNTRTICNLDCNWYTAITIGGYPEHPAGGVQGLVNWAFFPLSPLLARAVASAGRVPANLGNLIVSNLAAIVAAPLLFLYCKRNYSRRLAINVVLLLCFSPFSLYYSTGYSEALFMTLSVGTYLLWQREKYLLAGVVGALASATRPTGIFLAPALAAGWIACGRKAILGEDDAALRRGAALATMPLGLALFMIHLHATTGDAIAFIHAQAGWMSASSSFGRIGEGLEKLDWMTIAGVAAAVTAIVVTAYLFAARQYAEGALVLLGGVLVICLRFANDRGVGSIPRYVFGLFPVYIVGAAGLVRAGIPRWIFLPVLVAAEGVYSFGWITGAFYIF